MKLFALNIALFVIVGAFAIHVDWEKHGLIHEAVAPDDRSFFREIDTNGWPGDQLSKQQVEAAITHFAEPDVCQNSWRWALIGPNEWLLKGTRYHLLRVPEGADWPHFNIVHGFWGGSSLDTVSLNVAKIAAESSARDDCSFGAKP